MLQNYRSLEIFAPRVFKWEFANMQCDEESLSSYQ